VPVTFLEAPEIDEISPDAASFRALSKMMEEAVRLANVALTGSRQRITIVVHC